MNRVGMADVMESIGALSALRGVGSENKLATGQLSWLIESPLKPAAGARGAADERETLEAVDYQNEAIEVTRGGG